MGVEQKKEQPGKVVQKVSSVFLTAILLIGALTGCSSASSDKAAGGAKEAAVASNSAATSAKAEAKPAAAAVADKAAKPGTDASPQAGITPPIAADNGDGLNRKLIYKANLVMEVKDYGDAQTKLRDLAALSGAFILQFTETTNDREKSGNYTIKVAAKGFAQFLDGVEKISPTLQRSVQGQDVTEEYVDLEARLKAKQTVEARLLTFIDKAQKAEDLVAFSNELSKVQTEIEQIKGRMRYLDQNVALSTIELRMYEKLGNAAVHRSGWFALGERADQALSGSLNLMSVAMQGLIVFAAGALPLLIILAAMYAAYRIVRPQRMRKTSSESDSSINSD